MNIGIEVKKLRRELLPDVNQMEFAKRIGITQSYLSLIETGKRTPEIGLLKIIAKELDLPLPIIFWYLVDENDISDNKKEAFRVIKPIMDSLIGQAFTKQ